MNDIQTMIILMIVINVFSAIHSSFLFAKKKKELHSRSLMTEEQEEKEALLIVEQNFFKRYATNSIIFCVFWDIALVLIYISNQH